MVYKYLIPAALLLGACTEMQGGAGLSTQAGADGSVFNDEDRPDYREGGDPVLDTSGGLSDDEDE